MIIHNNSDRYWMDKAIQIAHMSNNHGEVPIGAILVLNNNIIGYGGNSSINNHDPTAHAEIIALRTAGKYLKNYRLLNTTLYVTLEPCLMCFGAIFLSRVSTLVYGASNTNNCYQQQQLILNNIGIKKLKIKKGVLEHDCSKILNDFFYKKRYNKSHTKIIK
ncbi:MAG: tRNA adenosine(34) deaminase TadA [Buchnera aphidicola (Eriosoma harunire)]